MRKEEFLQILRRALTGDVPPQVVEENIRYYDGYITEEVRKGKTEEAVIAEIGDPRLIARTIEDTTDMEGRGRYRDSESYEYDGGTGGSQTGGTYSRSPFDQGRGRSFHVFRMDKWYTKLLTVLIIFGILYLVVMVVGGIFTLLAPLIGPLLLIWLVVTIFQNMRR